MSAPGAVPALNRWTAWGAGDVAWAVLAMAAVLLPVDVTARWFNANYNATHADLVSGVWILKLTLVALAAAGTRTARNLAALLLAVGGVALLARVSLDGAPLGFALAFANAGLFTLYVVLGHRVAQRGASGGVDGLAAAMLVAAVVATPIGGRAAAAALSRTCGRGRDWPILMSPRPGAAASACAWAAT